MPRRSKYWVFTSYHLDDEGGLAIPQFEPPMTYLVYGWETCPKTKREHLQGYVEYERSVELTRSQSLLKLGKCSHRARRGTSEQAADYCKKADTKDHPDNWEEFGELSVPSQGKRSDQLEYIEAVENGEFTNWREILFDRRFLTVTSRMGNWAKEIFNEWQSSQIPTKRQVEVHVYWGDTGTGKTHAVLTRPEPVFKWNANAMRGSWTGYQGEKTILIDEFYGQIRLEEMLRILDGWKEQVHVNYSYAFLQHTKVFITSNIDPEEWYNSWAGKDVEIKKAFFDRLTEVKHFSGDSRRVKPRTEVINID